MVGVTERLQSLDKLWKQIKEYINDELLLKSSVIEEYDNDCSLVYLVAKAHDEWVQSKNFFQEVNDPDLIDHAVYAMEAAERKYIYLLKKARKEKVIDENIYKIYEEGLA